MSGNLLHQQRNAAPPRRHAIALGLAVPARHAGQPMGDVLDLDVERRGVEQVEPAAPTASAARRAAAALSRAIIAAWRAATFVAVAVDQMVVHQPAGLHEGIDDGRPDRN